MLDLGPNLGSDLDSEPECMTVSVPVPPLRQKVAVPGPVPQHWAAHRFFLATLNTFHVESAYWSPWTERDTICLEKVQQRAVRMGH
jgi:hypothetical protein